MPSTESSSLWTTLSAVWPCMHGEREGERERRERIQEELLDEQAAKTSLYKGLRI